MSAPRSPRRQSADRGRAVTLFEQEYHQMLWRVADAQWEGQRRIQIWPLYRDRQSGEFRYCSARYGSGGFVIPFDRVPELVAALSTIAPDEN